jgi:hypothetical protein
LNGADLVSKALKTNDEPLRLSFGSDTKGAVS